VSRYLARKLEDNKERVNELYSIPRRSRKNSDSLHDRPVALMSFPIIWGNKRDFIRPRLRSTSHRTVAGRFALDVLPDEQKIVLRT